MKFEIVFENDNVLVVDKKSGVIVNRSETSKDGTLQDELSNYFSLKVGDLGIGDRAGIVHRLDRETSGLLVVAKTEKAFLNLQLQFKNREVKKTYTALVHGNFLNDQGSIDAQIARIGKFGKFGVIRSNRREDYGREASTEYKVISNFKIQNSKFKLLTEKQLLNKNRLRYLEAQASDYSLVEFYPKTGRTHQIRVHAKSIGHSIVSDLIYSPNKLIKFDLLWCPRLFLHAAKIEFRDFKTKKTLKFEAELPKDLKRALGYLV